MNAGTRARPSSGTRQFEPTTVDMGFLPAPSHLTRPYAVLLDDGQGKDAEQVL